MSNGLSSKRWLLNWQCARAKLLIAHTGEIESVRSDSASRAVRGSNVVLKGNLREPFRMIDAAQTFPSAGRVDWRSSS